MYAPTLLQPPRWRAAAAALAAVLAAHALLLGLWPRAPGPGWRTQPMPRVQVRQLPVAATVVPKTPAPVTPAAAPTPVAAAAATPTRRPATAAARPRPAPEAAAQTEAAAAADPGGLDVPVYATQPPHSATLRYRLHRSSGGSGSAELKWALADDGSYSLALQLSGRGAVASGWSSVGRIDAHGLAPERGAESQRGRERRAVHFQRAAARITFSGPQIEYPLLPGAQDRLSWMLQLPAIVAADPALAAPGRQVAMFVAGARGDAEVWTFTVLDNERVELPGGGSADAVHLQRLPQRPYDAQVDVWLDPARHHLPVRTRLLVRPTGETSDLLLEAAP